jgi:hypothetical protein
MKPGSIAIDNMPTARDINVLSVLEKEGVINPILNVDEADEFIAKLQARNFPIFSPPGTNSTRTCTRNNTAATKTKLKAEKKAVKEKKAQADKEKKLAVATCKLKAQAKKRKKAIALAEARAQKALAKADALQTQLAAAKAANETVRTPTWARGAHVPKKSKGVGGGVALLTPTKLTTIANPQQKGSSPKKRAMVHSPHRSMTKKVASLSGSSTCGSDSNEHMASSSESESSSSLGSTSSGQGARAVFSGGLCHALLGSWRGGRGQQPTLRSRYAESSDKSSSSAVGSDSSPSHSSSSKQSSGGKNLSL